MTQEQLVKIAIDSLIHGKNDENYWWQKILGNDALYYHDNYCLSYHTSRHDYNKNKWFYIYFDKNVKNMAMLCVLFKDWIRINNQEYYYKNWVEAGVLYETK